MPSFEVDAFVVPGGDPTAEANLWETDTLVADAIVVHGGNITDEGELAKRNFERLNMAIVLFHRGIAPRMIMAGGRQLFGSETTPSDISEAELMKAYAIKNQVPEEAILIEDSSRDTIGNALNVKRKFLQPNGWYTIVAVTGHSHEARCKRILEDTLGDEFTIHTRAAPERFSTIKRARMMWGALTRHYIFNGIEKGNDIAIEQRLKERVPGYGEATQRQLRVNSMRDAIFHPPSVR